MPLIAKYVFVGLCFFVTGFFCLSYAHRHPDKILINSKEEFLKYSGISSSSGIKFSLADYVGTWVDSAARKEEDFIFREDLSVENDYRKGKCKILEQTNNTLLLQCEGFWGKDRWGQDTLKGPQYIRLEMFYFSETEEAAKLYMNITFNQDLDCARRGLAQDFDDCFKSAVWGKPSVYTWNFHMYYKSRTKEIVKERLNDIKETGLQPVIIGDLNDTDYLVLFNLEDSFKFLDYCDSHGINVFGADGYWVAPDWGKLSLTLTYAAPTTELNRKFMLQDKNGYPVDMNERPADMNEIYFEFYFERK